MSGYDPLIELTEEAPAEAGEPEALRMAYKTGYQEGVEDSDGNFCRDACEEGWGQYLEALRAQPQAREDVQPVAWMMRERDGHMWAYSCDAEDARLAQADGFQCRPLYTHPLTPREKVENALYSMEDWRRASPEYLIDNILTALASGSGDHAELIEDAMDALQIIDAFPSNQGEVEGRITEKGDRMLSSCTRDVRRALEALLAENAALRAENEHIKKLRHQAIDRSRLWEIDAIKWETRATEAERKLAEAAEMLESFRDQARVGYGGIPVTRSRRVNVPANLFHQVCAWLSKEPEPTDP